MSNTFNKQKPIEIPKLKKVTHRKRAAFKWTSISLIILFFIFLGFYGTSKFYDSRRVTFQNPILLVIRKPIVITKRFILKDLPKAEYAEVNPLTTPQQIADTVKNHGTFDYAQTDPVETINRDTVRALIHNKVVQKWGEAAWPDVDYIITRESNYQPYIVNKSSGACGLFQALPCTKLPSMDITDQINWGMKYIEQRYENPANARGFWKEHNWY